jgi:hypothetical protein
MALLAKNSLPNDPLVKAAARASTMKVKTADGSGVERCQQHRKTRDCDGDHLIGSLDLDSTDAVTNVRADEAHRIATARKPKYGRPSSHSSSLSMTSWAAGSANCHVDGREKIPQPRKMILRR